MNIYIVIKEFSYLQKSTELPGTLQDPTPHVMVFIPQTRVLTRPRQSPTVRGIGCDKDTFTPEEMMLHFLNPQRSKVRINMHTIARGRR